MREESVRVIRSLGALKDLRPAWDALSTDGASPMQSHDWVRVWAEVSGVDTDLEILVAGDPPAVAIAPLFRSRRSGRRLELASSGELGEAMDFLYSDPSSVAAVARAIARSRLPLRVWRVPADSPAVEALKGAYRRRGLVRCRPSLGCPSLPLDATWADPERHLDAHRRSNVRRARRIAEGMGEVTVEILSPEPAEVEPLVQEAYAVESNGWKGWQGSSLAQDALWGEFFRRYAVAASERGILRVCFLRIGGRAAAMKLAAVTGNRFWLLSTGYSEEFARCSPGTLLMLETIRYASAAGLRSYEFLGADEPWIQSWRPLLRACVSVRSYPIGARGAAALASDVAANVRERIRPYPRALARRMARAYVAGPSVEDAVRACRSLEAQGFRSTIGYVDAPNDPARIVARHTAAAIDAIGGGGFDASASVKAPILRFSRELFGALAERARKWDVDLRFDALAAQDVDETLSVIREIRAVHPRIALTLPGRWRRSAGDADRAVDLGLGVRVVKGEWAARRDLEIDPKVGYLAVVDRIAGRVRHVAVATHDPALAREALRTLRAAGTPCELEVLMGYPAHRVIPVARAEGVPVRVYVPFGDLALPYTMRQVGRNPRIAAWALRDLLRTARKRSSSGPSSVGPPSVSGASGTLLSR